MDFSIEFSQEADIEFNIIDCYLNAIGSNVKFHKDFHLQIVRIKLNPYQFQIKYKGIRVVHLKKFNYSIHYMTQDKIITVLRILHQNQFYR